MPGLRGRSGRLLVATHLVAFPAFALAGCEWVYGIGDTTLTPRVEKLDDGGARADAGMSDRVPDATSRTGGAVTFERGDAATVDASLSLPGIERHVDASPDAVVPGPGVSESGTVARILRPALADRFFKSSQLWSGEVRFCFRAEGENSLSVDVLAARAAFGEHVGELLQSTWARYVPLRFLWLGACAGTAAQVEITLSDSRPSASSVGDSGAPVSAVVLNTNGSDAEVLHFLGRLLGFQNEYGLDHAPGPCVSCSRDEQCTFGRNLSCLPDGFCGWAGDHESIMASPGCSGIEPTRRFTAWDVAGANRAYGRKHPGAIVDHLGYCLDDPASSVLDNQALVVWPCFGYPNDSWAWNTGQTPLDSDVLVCSLGGQDRCIAMSEPTSDARTTPAVLDGCDRENAAQNWQFEWTRIRSLGGVCIVAASVAPGALLTTAECGTVSPERERWIVRGNQARLANTSLCASVRSVRALEGTQLALADCDAPDAADTQSFVTGSGTNQGHLLWGDLCVALSNDSAEGGSFVVLSGACDTRDETQLFFLSGPISTPALDRCLTSSPDGQNELWTSVVSCDRSIEQEWDYYW